MGWNYVIRMLLQLEKLYEIERLSRNIKFEKPDRTLLSEAWMGLLMLSVCRFVTPNYIMAARSPQ